MTLLVVVLVPVTVGLGFWQIDRGAQKRAIEEARLASYGALPVDESHLMTATALARVRIEGRYDGARQFLVDNRSQRGVPGYVVVTPFETVGGQARAGRSRLDRSAGVSQRFAGCAAA